MPRRLQIRRHPASPRQRKSCNRSYGKLPCLFHIDRISSLTSWAARIPVLSGRPSVQLDNIECWPIAFTFRSHRYGPAVRQLAYLMPFPLLIALSPTRSSKSLLASSTVPGLSLLKSLSPGFWVESASIFPIFSFSFFSFAQSDASLSCKVLCGRPPSRSAD